MKHAFILAVVLGLSLSTYCQNIGLRVNVGFSENKEMNATIGGGFYVSTGDSVLKMFDFVMYGDYMVKKSSSDNCLECPTVDVSAAFKELSIGTGALLVGKIHTKTRLKAGPILSYNNVMATRQGQTANWIETFNAHFVGAGFLVNLQQQEVFNLPINFDTFISSSYLINVGNRSNPVDTRSAYSGNLLSLNLQIGLSYRIK